MSAHIRPSRCRTAAVPLIVSGPDIPGHAVVSQLASHVDLFPTVIECVGARLMETDADLPGRSLLDAIRRPDTSRIAFAEYHGHGSKAGKIIVRAGTPKLFNNVGMPPRRA